VTYRRAGDNDNACVVIIIAMDRWLTDLTNFKEGRDAIQLLEEFNLDFGKPMAQ